MKYFFDRLNGVYYKIKQNRPANDVSKPFAGRFMFVYYKYLISSSLTPSSLVSEIPKSIFL